MSLTLDAVLGWRPDRLAEIADELATGRRRMLAVQDDLDAGRLPSGWSGDAADAARTNQRRLVDALEDLVAEVSAVVRAVDVASVALERAQTLLNRALADGAQEGFVLDTAALAFTDPLQAQEPHEDGERALRMAELSDHLEQGMRAAEHADAELARLLVRVARGLVGGGAASLGDAAGIGRRAGTRSMVPPPVRGRAGDWFAWWRTLTQQERRGVIEGQPDLIGNVDGIPARARNLANLARLLELLRVSPSIPGLAAVRRLMANHHGDRQLIGLDVNGADGVRAVITIGDLDRARNVTVFTPGLGSNVADKLDDYDRDLAALRDRADELSGEGSNALVLYLGADLPQIDLSLFDFGDRSVANDDLAREGAGSLSDFLRGVDASRPVDPHLTAAGHSYGSLMTAWALRRPSGVDETLFLGSPGLGVDDLSRLDVPDGHHHLLEAKWDGVGDVGWFGPDPSGLDGMRHLSTDAHHDPDLTGVRGHSSYLADGSTSQHNLAAVGADRHDLLIDDTRGPGLTDRAGEEVRRVRELMAKGWDLLR